MNEAKIQELKKLATEVRLGILEGVHAAASGHHQKKNDVLPCLVHVISFLCFDSKWQ